MVIVVEGVVTVEGVVIMVEEGVVSVGGCTHPCHSDVFCTAAWTRPLPAPGQLSDHTHTPPHPLSQL